MKIKLTDFALRHFPKESGKKLGGTQIVEYSPEAFEKSINSKFELVGISSGISIGPVASKLLDGYADFCKILIVENFTDAKTGTMSIDLTTFPYLRSGYSSRRKGELSNLSQWLEIPKDLVPKARYLAIVLYSKEQLELENDSVFKSDSDYSNCEWGIVAILGQMQDKEEPMKPMTMLRNHLGIEFGGSGHPIDEKKYQESVDFWSKNATVKPV